MSALYETAASWAAQGWRIEALTPTAAVLTSGHRPGARFHLLNAAATVMTCGFWVVGWIALTVLRHRARRVMITVDGDDRPTVVTL
jgi:hypothetical protein